MAFGYDEAFSRNLGWLSRWDQQLLRDKRVAIAGMGGVGGAHLLTLARLGIGRFHIADFDRFELGNFNRQVGATMSTIGRSKVRAMEAMARDINPTLDLVSFEEGVHAECLDAFLDGVDLFVDGLDIYAIEVRRTLFARCRELGIPAITAAPVGFGTGYVVFDPEGMSFDEYADQAKSEGLDRTINLLTAAAPKPMALRYLSEPEFADLRGGRGPSTPVGVQLCAGVVGAAAVKILLGRGVVRPAPYFHQFDAFHDRFVSGRLAGWRKVPHRLVRFLFKRSVEGKRSPAPARDTPVTSPRGVLEEILDEARWAPSGDNDQPWRFVIEGPERVRLRVARQDNVYDLDGLGTLLSIGCFVETARIAASQRGRALDVEVHGPDALTLRFVPDDSVTPSPLAPFVRVRSVDRAPFRTRRLTDEEKGRLERALGDDLRVRFFETPLDRLRLAALHAATSDIRLRLPEARAVHERIIDFERDQSPDRIPAAALGLDPLTRKTMRWALTSDRNNELLLRLSGTLLPRAQLDVLPGIACAAQLIVTWRKLPDLPLHERQIRAGEHMQRFWLEATRLGLSVQPGYAPVAFSRYAEDGLVFTGSDALRARAAEVAGRLRALSGQPSAHGVAFAGRIGAPRSTARNTRSTRLPLEKLIVARAAQAQTPARAR